MLVGCQKNVLAKHLWTWLCLLLLFIRICLCCILLKWIGKSIGSLDTRAEQFYLLDAFVFKHKLLEHVAIAKFNRRDPWIEPLRELDYLN